MITPSYEVHLEMFEGPLDLLLFLIRKNDLDVYEIPISEITQEYLSYLDMMKDLNLEMAGEFLVMASTLMQIKARMLLPSHEGEDAEGPDPREELISKLLEYQKFKEAAKFLEKRADEFKDVFYRGAPHFSDEEKTLSLSMFDLLSTLREILEGAEDRGMVIEGDQFPVEAKVLKIQQLLETRQWISFREIFHGETRKLAILSCFMALLELIKLQKVFARQDASFGEILVYKKENLPASPIWPGADEPAASAPAGELPLPDRAAPPAPSDDMRSASREGAHAPLPELGASAPEADATPHGIERSDARPFIGTAEDAAAKIAEPSAALAQAPTENSAPVQDSAAHAQPPAGESTPEPSPEPSQPQTPQEPPKANEGENQNGNA
ncbi:MAG: segregation/condensation protein A [Proteobacteria bacterium]|nr:segregation/condensation protein A [Pseudomonadota bacterium]